MRARVALVVATLLFASCADDGRELRPPDPDATVPTSAPTQPDAGFEAQTSVADFVFTAEAFDDGGPIPLEHTCDGADTSPALSWAGVPFGAAELAVVVTDPDAQFFTHWVITGLSPDSTGLTVGEVPEGAVEARNDFGTLGWAGPCPPEAHRYVFSLHVLVEPLGLAPDVDAATAVGLVESATIRQVSFSGTYGPAA